VANGGVFISSAGREADGDGAIVASRMPEIEEAIAFLMDVNYRLAGTGAANALVASLPLRARELRERHRVRQ
jgi:hypothetical protein